MRLRAVVVMVGLTSVGVAVANCGSEDGSAFNNGGSSGDGGSSTTPPAFGGSTVDGGGGSSNSCTKLTCADLKINCGPAGDGCGGLIENCGTCQGLETCGGGGTASVCGGSAGCVKKTCADLGFNCGPAGDGCGGLLECGTCQGAEFCGGGGPSKCGGGQRLDDGGVLNPDGGVCVPDNTCPAGSCGPLANGCGGFRGAGGTCGGCPSGTSCGGGGVSSQCGAPACTKRTCQDANANCGVVADGCGGIVDCGGPSACTVAGEFCGGGGPNRCGRGVIGDAGSTCTNLCADRPTDCSGPNTPNTTTITGTVYMPNGTLPVYDALVYVPNGTVSAIPTGIGATCVACEAQATGAPLVSTRTNALGQFTLPDMPWRAGGVPLVIQKGRWRKQITINLTRCGTTNLSPTYPQPAAANNTTFGRTQSATNNIPKMAVMSGERDSLQCLLRKVGIADTEFTQPAPTGNGRVNLYAGGSGGTTGYETNFNGYTGSARDLPAEGVLYGNSDVGTVDTTRLLTYDAVVLSCNGNGEDRQAALAGYRAEMQAYANAGGKIFASHWHHSWLEYGAAPWGTGPGALATIQHQNDLVKPITATINTAATFPKGIALADWLVHTHTLDGTAASPRGQLVLGTAGFDDGAQHTINAVDTTRVNQWISIPTPRECSGGGACDPPGAGQSPNNSVQYFDFNTPVGAATQCGRFVISDLHVATAADNSARFPNANCGNSTALTDQERVLAFMLFDLTSCIEPIVPPPPPTCQPLTCAQQGIACGQAGNGCGATITCNACPENQVCQGNPPACVTPSCTPVACDGRCGTVANGCGGTLSCGDCPQGQVCGGSGPNRCGSNSCTPTTCSAQNIQCGPAGNGCGGLLDCGPCPQGQTCGGGGTPGVCGAPACTPRTCAQANANCGFVANGCGGVVDCGPCPNGQSCGGNGTPNQCGGGSVPK